MKKISITLNICLLLLVIQQGIFAQKPPKLYSYPFGVQAYTFRNHFPKGIEATLNIIQKLGFTELEGGGTGDLSIEVYKKLCSDRGISIPSIGTDFEQLEKNPQVVADRAKAFGAKFVMCAWIPHKGDDFTLEDTRRAVEVFNKAGKVLKENGLTFCYHPHGFEFRPYQDGTLLDYLFQQTKSENVSFEMDVLWVMHGGGNPVKLLEKYGNRWQLMHVKDLRKGAVGNFTGHSPAEDDVVVGTGQADWRKIFELAKKIGIKHFFIEDESNHELENIPLSIEYLKGL